MFLPSQCLGRAKQCEGSRTKSKLLSRTMKGTTMIKSDMSRRGLSIGQQLSTPRAYKRWPALTNSTWYKGMLHSQMAGTADNDGAFDFVIAKLRRGTEPPPHVHSREDEFIYVLSGDMRVYVDGEVFR